MNQAVDPTRAAPGAGGDATPQASGWATALRLRSIWIIAVAIAAVVLAATAVVMLAGDRLVPSYPTGSPEAALQEYLRSWSDEDYVGAYRHLSTRAQAQMSLAEFAYLDNPSRRHSVTIDRVSGEGDRRTIYLTIDEYYTSDRSGHSSTAAVPMLFESGEWRIDRALVGLDWYHGED